MKILRVKDLKDNFFVVFKIKTERDIPYQKYSKNIKIKESIRIVR